MKTNFTKMSPEQQDMSNTVKFHDDEKNGVTVCTLYDRWYGRRFIAKTRCHEVDQYDQRVGRAIAFNKARRKELLSDIDIINYQRKELTRMYEDEMNRLDKSEGLKHIYLAGVDEELRELMNGYQCDVDTAVDNANVQIENLQPEEISKDSVKEKPENFKLTQFANFTEREF